MSETYIHVIDSNNPKVTKEYLDYGIDSLDIKSTLYADYCDDILYSNFNFNNSKIWSKIAELSKEYPDFKYVFIHEYNDDSSPKGYSATNGAADVNYYKVEVQNGEVRAFMPTIVYAEEPDFKATLEIDPQKQSVKP